MTETHDDVKRAVFSDANDPAFLAVKGNFETKEESKAFVKNLSQAIYTVFQKHGYVKLRCIGAASLNNAIKAHIIAAGEANKKGVRLVLEPSFTTVSFDGSQDRTAVVLKVVEIK